MSVNEFLANLGKLLIGKRTYDFDAPYDHFKFLKAKFNKKREEIKKINKSLYGKW